MPSRLEDVCGPGAVGMSCNHLSGCDCFYGDERVDANNGGSGMSIAEDLRKAADVIVVAGGVAGDISGSPPKDFNKFNRAVGPYMKAMAQQSGVSVFAFWFGDVVRIDGRSLTFNIIGSPGEISMAEIVFRQEADRLGRVFVFRCEVHSDLDSIASLQSTCYFQDLRSATFVGPPPEDPDTAPPPGGGPDVFPPPEDPTVLPPTTQAGFFGGLSPTAQAVIAGGGLIFLLSRFGRGRSGPGSNLGYRGYR